MRCPHCSAFLDRGSNRCWRCWLPITGDEPGSIGPRLSRAERRRALEREQHRAWRRRIFRAGGVVLLVGLAAFFVYDTIVVPNPRPDDDRAAGMLPTLDELPSAWSRSAEAPNLAPGSLAECESTLGAPFGDATDGEAVEAFQLNNGSSLLVAQSFLLNGDDDELAEEIVRAFGRGCTAGRVAQRVAAASGLENAGTEPLDLEAGNATVRGRRVGGGGGGGPDAWVVDVVAVGVDRGLVVFARASQGGVTGGVNSQELVELVVPRIADQVSE